MSSNGTDGPVSVRKIYERPRQVGTVNEPRPQPCAADRRRRAEREGARVTGPLRSASDLDHEPVVAILDRRARHSPSRRLPFERGSADCRAVRGGGARWATSRSSVAREFIAFGAWQASEGRSFELFVIGGVALMVGALFRRGLAGVQVRADLVDMKIDEVPDHVPEASSTVAQQLADPAQPGDIKLTMATAPSTCRGTPSAQTTLSNSMSLTPARDRSV